MIVKMIVGWCEWLSLLELGIEKIKVKVDIGVCIFCIYVFDIEEFLENGENWVKFSIYFL